MDVTHERNPPTKDEKMTTWIDTQQSGEMTALVEMVRSTEGNSILVYGVISTANGVSRSLIEGSQLAILMQVIFKGENPADTYYNHCR